MNQRNQIYLLLLLPWTLAMAEPTCLKPLANLREWAWPRVRALRPSEFRWPGPVPKGAAGLHAVIAELNKTGPRVAPETLLALLDSLSPGESRSFGQILDSLAKQGIAVRFRATESERNGYRGPRWRWRIQGRFPYYKTKELLIDVADKPIKDATDLYLRLYELSVALGSAEMIQLAQKGARLPSYQKALIDSVTASDQRVYATVLAWENHFGSPPEKLAERDVRNWMLGYYGVPLRLLPSLFFFGIAPVKGHVPNRSGYTLYKKGVEEGWDHLLDWSNRKRFGPRATTKYLADSYGLALRVAALTAMSAAMYSLYQQLTSGEFTDEMKDSATVMGLLLDPELSDEEDPEWKPSPAVVEYFQKKIAAIETEIAKHGVTANQAQELAHQKSEQARLTKKVRYD